MYDKSLFCFTHDLRVRDHPALSRAHAGSKQITHVYFAGNLFEPAFLPGIKRSNALRREFISESLRALQSALAEQGHVLWVIRESEADALPKLIAQFGFDAIFRSTQVAHDETQRWDEFRSAYRQIDFVERESCSLFQRNQLPFSIEGLPTQFTPFRREVEAIAARPAMSLCTLSATAMTSAPDLKTWALEQPRDLALNWRGGERGAMRRLEAYFSSSAPSTYKQTRNSLWGGQDSTVLSPWLAVGALSPTQIVERLRSYEQERGANESTFWIYFELLWREFFHWHALQMGSSLFLKGGNRSRHTLTTFYPEQFKAWCQGSTPWPLVNACMKQLAETGWMSNRGRQVVASCLVNELQLDWRYGAAYFEQCLIDYDVGSNWGNWQYLAGVGADPRGQRRFDIAKQTQQFDPNGDFIDAWQGERDCQPIYTRDAADWPIG